jgi:hypothetical protein
VRLVLEGDQPWRVELRLQAQLCVKLLQHLGVTAQLLTSQ